ncbi:MAG: hypothetical protein FJ403_23915 [Verrucomicrobia bacterium]|nr:hypothetical protein [Verrucomicrobiota bacterium]
MTPLEGAVYLGVPNLMFIRYEDEPRLEEFESYAIAFRPMQRVVWSVVGASGRTSEAEREHVLQLAEKFPNITGFVMDDFFNKGKGSLTVEEVHALRPRLVIGGRRRDLYVVVYDYQLDDPLGRHLAECDRITYWTWRAEDLVKLEENFPRLERLAPARGKLLGCYLWNYGGGGGKPLPMELMRLQCELGLRWLREGKIEGMIFLASNVCDLELETVRYVRDWVDKVGDLRLG